MLEGAATAPVLYAPGRGGALEIECSSTSCSFPDAQLGARPMSREVHCPKGQEIPASSGELDLGGSVPEAGPECVAGEQGTWGHCPLLQVGGWRRP